MLAAFVASPLFAQAPVTFTVGTATAARGQLARGAIEVPAGVDAALTIPVAVAHGAKPGPVLAIVSGAFLTPVLLPFIPFRSFAIKGWIMGLLAVLFAVQGLGLVGVQSMPLLAVTYLFFPALSSYIALQFTGSTTFTGISGVKKELKIGIPLYVGAAGVSLIMVVVFKLREWGLV